MAPHLPRASRDVVALTLAIGICTALNLVTIAVLINAANGTVNAGGLSENGTQVLTGWGGGIIGILGAVFGYRAGQAERDRLIDAGTPPPVPDDDEP